MDPEATHLLSQVLAQVGEISVLGADQVGPVAGGDVGIGAVLSIVTDAAHSRRGIRFLLGQEQSGSSKGQREQAEESDHGRSLQ